MCIPIAIGSANDSIELFVPSPASYVSYPISIKMLQWVLANPKTSIDNCDIKMILN